MSLLVCLYNTSPITNISNSVTVIRFRIKGRLRVIFVNCYFALLGMVVTFIWCVYVCTDGARLNFHSTKHWLVILLSLFGITKNWLVILLSLFYITKHWLVILLSLFYITKHWLMILLSLVYITKHWLMMLLSLFCITKPVLTHPVQVTDKWVYVESYLLLPVVFPLVTRDIKQIHLQMSE